MFCDLWEHICGDAMDLDGNPIPDRPRRYVIGLDHQFVPYNFVRVPRDSKNLPSNFQYCDLFHARYLDDGDEFYKDENGVQHDGSFFYHYVWLQQYLTGYRLQCEDVMDDTITNRIDVVASNYSLSENRDELNGNKEDVAESAEYVCRAVKGYEKADYCTVCAEYLMQKLVEEEASGEEEGYSFAYKVLTVVALKVVISVVDGLLESGFVRHIRMEKKLMFHLKPRMWHLLEKFLTLKISSDCTQRVMIRLLELEVEESIQQDITLRIDECRQIVEAFENSQDAEM